MEGEEELPEGTPDKRSYSRAQMHVFNKYFSTLDDDVQQEWLTLCKPGGAPGKRERKNEIVNAVVGRSASFGAGLTIKHRTLRNCTVLKRADANVKTEKGITQTEMESKHGEALFQKGLARGDFVQNPKDGLYYSRQALCKTLSKAKCKASRDTYSSHPTLRALCKGSYVRPYVKGNM